MDNLIFDISNYIFELVLGSDLINLLQINSKFYNLIINNKIYKQLYNFYNNYDSKNNIVYFSPLYINYFLDSCKKGYLYVIKYLIRKYDLKSSYKIGFLELLKSNNLDIISWYFKNLKFSIDKFDFDKITNTDISILKLETIKFISDNFGKNLWTIDNLCKYCQDINLDKIIYICQEEKITTYLSNCLIVKSSNNKSYKIIKWLLSTYKFDQEILNKIINLLDPLLDIYILKLFYEIIDKNKKYNNDELLFVACQEYCYNNQDLELQNITQLLEISNFNEDNLILLLKLCLETNKIELFKLILNKKLSCISFNNFIKNQ